MEIESQSAIVTGGGSGLGRATALRLAELGANVSIFDFNEQAANSVADEIGGHSIKVDVGEEASVAAAFSKLNSPPRIIVNCAGIGTAARIVGREGKLSTDVFERTLRVNLIGTYNVMSYGSRVMQSLEPIGDERGVIINTASVAYQDGQLGQSAYAASKGGIVSMTLPAARELAQFGIRVMSIAPGLFYTPMMEGLPEEVSKEITSNIQFPKRLGEAKEYAQLVVDIVKNTYLNGTVIRLDGAVRLPPR